MVKFNVNFNYLALVQRLQRIILFRVVLLNKRDFAKCALLIFSILALTSYVLTFPSVSRTSNMSSESLALERRK